MIRRRHILYIEGYDPQGAEGYYGLFQTACLRWREVWRLRLKLGSLELLSDDFAAWNVDAGGPNWSVAVRYEFLRQERFIRADMAEPMRRHIPRVLRWIAGDLVSGTLARILWASWRFGLAILYFELLIVAWLAVPIAVGVIAARALAAYLPSAVAALAAVALAFALFLALRPLADRLRAIQITSHWPLLRRYASGQATWFDAVIETGARHLVTLARANAADEIVVIGHSGGGVVGPAIVARALELDPDVGGHGPSLVLLTLGSIMPAVALHPGARRMREVIARIAVEPSVAWIDCQSRKDVVNFWDFDPVAGIGVDVGAWRRNPLIWIVRFKDMVSPEYYRRFRWSFFRLHYQFIMAGDRRAPYDYLMLICSPAAIADWARNPAMLFGMFSQDGALAATPVEPAPASLGRLETIARAPDESP
jgi:hypothetical protein